jgi:hypothetical protein
MAGFSIWVALSLVLLGITYLLVSRQAGVVLRPFVGVGLTVSAAFTAVAATCFILFGGVGRCAGDGALLGVVDWERSLSDDGALVGRPGKSTVVHARQTRSPRCHTSKGCLSGS